ncbi:hypothetical protein [Streptomyces sp. NPDC002952]|uniref:hypothetical protein n=1 Tax=Streptomyces sp. NPDC002952 TaxID=3364673 RepID=UPI003688DC3F
MTTKYNRSLAAALLTVASLGSMSLASAAGVAQAAQQLEVAGGFITVSDTLAATYGQDIPLPSTSFADAHGAKVTMNHLVKGAYFFTVRGATPGSSAAGFVGGVTHAMSTGIKNHSSCHATEITRAGKDLFFGAVCVDAGGAPSDHSFDETYSQGVPEEGQVTLVRREFPLNVNGKLEPTFHRTNGRTDSSTLERTAKGRYTVVTPRLAGTGGESFAVTSEDPERVAERTNCHFLSHKSVNAGKNEEFKVACDNFSVIDGVAKPVDPTGLQLSYSRGASIIGLKSVASDAHVNVPFLTAGTITPSGQRNRIYGANSGKITVKHDPTRKGNYIVRLPAQGSGIGSSATIVTATSSGFAYCSKTQEVTVPTSTPGRFDRHLTVVCQNASGLNVDSGFELQYIAKQ